MPMNNGITVRGAPANLDAKRPDFRPRYSFASRLKRDAAAFQVTAMPILGSDNTAASVIESVTDITTDFVERSFDEQVSQLTTIESVLEGSPRGLDTFLLQNVWRGLRPQRWEHRRRKSIHAERVGDPGTG